MRSIIPAILVGCYLIAGGGYCLGFSTVVVDAGHGGKDRGGMPKQRISEKLLTLDVAKRVNRLLRSQGLRTVMTRRNDQYISLPERVRIANRQEDAIFVSIHFNASSNRQATGIETFHFGDGHGLATNIQNEMIRACRTDNRGVKRRGFYVLRHTKIPSVLVECGFLTNRAEGKRCQSSAYRQLIAEQIVRGIMAEKAGRRLEPSIKPGLLVNNSASKNSKSGQASIVISPEADQDRSVPKVVTRTSSKAQPAAALSSYSQRELRQLFLRVRSPSVD